VRAHQPENIWRAFVSNLPEGGTLLAGSACLVLLIGSLLFSVANTSASGLRPVTNDSGDRSVSPQGTTLPAWEPPINISQSPEYVSRYPDLVVDRTGRLHVVWVEHLALEEIENQRPDLGPLYSDSESNILYTTWDGGTWSVPLDISFEPQSIILPTIAVDDTGVVHLVYWYRGHHYYIYSKAGGEVASARAWSQPLDLSEVLGTGSDRFPNLTIDAGGTLHLTYTSHAADLTDDGQRASLRWYTYSQDKGQTWAEPLLFGTYEPGTELASAYAPDTNVVLDDQGTLHAILFDKDGLASYARSIDRGQTWTGKNPVSADPDQVDKAANLALIDGQVHVFWSDSQRALYHRWSADGGSSWSTVSQLATNRSYSPYGGIATAGDSLGRLLIAYPHERDIWSRLWDGEGWSEAVNVSRDPDRFSFWPRMVVSRGNTAHLIWYTGFPEVGLFDAVKRLSRGEYEIHYSQLKLDAPAIAPLAYELLPAARAEPTQAPTVKTDIDPVPGASPTAPLSMIAGQPAATLGSPQTPLLFGVLAATVVILGVIIVRLRTP
jgi:hypothetical protein